MIKSSQLKAWEKKGKGSETNFFGFEKSNSPLAELRARVKDLDQKLILVQMKEAGGFFKEYSEQLARIKKAAAKLYELTGDVGYRQVSEMKRIDHITVDVAEFFYSKGLKGSHSTSMFSMSEFRTVEGLLEKIPSSELKMIMQIP